MEKDDLIHVACPHCGARLTLDRSLGKIIAHEPPARGKSADLDRVADLLEKEKARREALFEQSVADEKVKGKVLDRKFEEALKKTKDQPITRPTRDLDLD
ncbi:MAG: hypothetical protein DMG22_00755 [Acidobacteria bacterium]|nr:MAG: hypothetical protein DMG22_00755 [Acidobacteriota bacterium]